MLKNHVFDHPHVGLGQAKQLPLGVLGFTARLAHPIAQAVLVDAGNSADPPMEADLRRVSA
ncbi:hypothetical protein D3C78_1857270 [compost metagenome]